IDQLKRSLDEVRESRDFARAIVETVPGPLVILDADLHVMIGNKAFYDTLQRDRKSNPEGQLSDWLRGEWDPAPLNECLRRALTKNRKFQDLEIEGNFERIGQKTYSMVGRCVNKGGNARKILMVQL